MLPVPTAIVGERRIVVPLASALVARRDHYFDLLNAYRTGDVRPLIATFAESSRIAATESQVSQTVSPRSLANGARW